MSHSVMAEEGANAIFTALQVSFLSGSNLVVRLFKSNTTPAKTDTIGTYTQADFDGYMGVGVGTWNQGGPDGAGRMDITASAACNFTVGSSPSGSQNIYGYYITDTSGSKLVVAERFDSAPVVMAVTGDSIHITPTITLVSEF